MAFAVHSRPFTFHLAGAGVLVLAAALALVGAGGCATEDTSSVEPGSYVALVEASGLAIRGGGTAAIVCGDETPDRLWGVNLANTDARWQLIFADRTPPLDDLEALAPWGEHDVVALCSLSRTKTRLKDPAKRKRLALVRLASDARTVLGISVYENLRRDVLRALEGPAGTQLREPDALSAGGPNNGGLNVEGLAVWQGRLLLGLRSPTTVAGPIVLPITNPEEVFAGHPPRFDDAVIVPAGPDEGIRSMTAGPDGAVLILLGPVTDAPGPAQRLIRWWPETSRVQDLTVPGLADVSPVEGISLLANGRLLAVSDYKPPLPGPVLHHLAIEGP